MCERWLYPCYVLCLGLGGRCETLAVSQLCSLAWSWRYMCERWLYPCCVLCLGLGGTCVNVGCIPVVFSV